MEIQNLLHADYLDILFDHRNKSYGGYELRKHYNNRATKATLIAFLSTGLLCIYSFVHHKEQSHILRGPFVEVHPTIGPILPPPPPPKIIPAHVQTHPDVFTPPVITNNDVKPDDLLRPHDKLPDAPPTPHTDNGTGTGTLPSTGDGTTNIVQPPSPSKPVTWVEQMPEFVGNFNNYIVSHIHYPEAARTANIIGRVIVRFVVNEDGAISDAIVIQGIGGGCDEEAVRVINGMPKWKPGRQNGQAVKVYCSVPINFLLQ